MASTHSVEPLVGFDSSGAAGEAADKALYHRGDVAMTTKTADGDWFAAAVPSDGSYDVPEGLMCSFPLRAYGNGGYEIVQGLEIDAFSR